MRKELIRPDRPHFAGEDAFRFRHLLIRDAAYDSLPKEARAQLHERLADWLEERRSELAEIDELVGHHLEQAHAYRVQLRPVDEHGRRLALRASELLSAAGSRALGRNDVGAAVKLLRRALALRREDDPAVALRLDLGAGAVPVQEISVLPARRRATRRPAPPPPGMKWANCVRVCWARG